MHAVKHPKYIYAKDIIYGNGLTDVYLFMYAIHGEDRSNTLFLFFFFFFIFFQKFVKENPTSDSKIIASVFFVPISSIILGCKNRKPA